MSDKVKNDAPAVMSNPVDFEHIFCVDAETDGLWGDHFAIAAVVLDDKGNKAAEFEGRVADMSVVKDPWVRENIVPLCEKLTPYDSIRELRDAFWDFWMTWCERALPMDDCGSSVEAHLFRKCIEDEPVVRTWQGPFPLLDLGTLLYSCGINPRAVKEGEEASRITLAGLADRGMNLHNPVDDAYASGLCWLKYVRLVREKLKA
jgi:hypothetical protein